MSSGPESEEESAAGGGGCSPSGTIGVLWRLSEELDLLLMIGDLDLSLEPVLESELEDLESELEDLESELEDLELELEDFESGLDDLEFDLEAYLGVVGLLDGDFEGDFEADLEAALEVSPRGRGRGWLDGSTSAWLDGSTFGALLVVLVVSESSTISFVVSMEEIIKYLKLDGGFKKSNEFAGSK